jgi:hypothetical protein
LFPTPHRSGTTWTLEVVTENATYILAGLCQLTCLKLLYELREVGGDGWEPVLARWVRESDEELRAYERGEFPDGTKFPTEFPGLS